MTNGQAIKYLSKTYINIKNDSLKDALSCALFALRNSQWISVDERLPNDYDTVLITIWEDASYGKGTDIMYHVCEGEYNKNGGYILIANGVGGFNTFNDWDEGQPIKVTHWMPLPLPPKGE